MSQQTEVVTEPQSSQTIVQSCMTCLFLQIGIICLQACIFWLRLYIYIYTVYIDVLDADVMLVPSKCQGQVVQRVLDTWDEEVLEAESDSGNPTEQ